MAREPEPRDSYPYSVSITTRWMDNDAYGHVNNVVFYSYFDTAANCYLIEQGGLDIQRSPVIALVVESVCHYHAPIAYPQAVSAGVRVDRLGQRSVTYGIGIFAGDSPLSAADGTFTHVFVDRAARTSVAIPVKMREALGRILRAPSV